MACSLPAKGGSPSAILYCNEDHTVYLIDIPASISLAQQESRYTGDDSKEIGTPSIFSCPPLEHPYSSPSTEPKGTKAMLRVMERIPAVELEYRNKLADLVNDALRELRANHDTQGWCLPRAMRPGYLQDISGKKQDQDRQVGEPNLGKLYALKGFSLSDGRQSTREDASFSEDVPPLILSPGLNIIPTLNSIRSMTVKNTSSAPALLRIRNAQQTSSATNLRGQGKSTVEPAGLITFTIPPKAAFCLTHMSTQPVSFPSLLSFLPSDRKFDFVIMDPPWPNRSVSRSAHYETIPTFSVLQRLINRILKAQLDPSGGIAAIWTTNNHKSRSAARQALKAAQLQPFEEWVWIKTTTSGYPVSPVRALWRLPYEVLVLGRQRLPSSDGKLNHILRRRVIAAVPDVHSRKPNLKEMVEQLFFTSRDADGEQRYMKEYNALEVFARNLTAGWWSCGDEVLRFNWDGWWTNAGATEPV
ncbi:MT-A70 family protein [Coccidioides immitis RS]|uniref:MT-A70 family protein n=1 Tax=Coccidioides immitis (strain RS) TaxID=246410 RepID=A0A0E1S010_COCIM|nr:MT-A70 family protein [Coccidioides immitis RS]EAS35409.2 MT-A70 family protein [Coccidioides immitis RS]